MCSKNKLTKLRTRTVEESIKFVCENKMDKVIMYSGNEKLKAHDRQVP